MSMYCTKGQVAGPVFFKALLTENKDVRGCSDLDTRFPVMECANICHCGAAFWLLKVCAVYGRAHQSPKWRSRRDFSPAPGKLSRLAGYALRRRRSVVPATPNPRRSSDAGSGLDVGGPPIPAAVEMARSPWPWKAMIPDWVGSLPTFTSKTKVYCAPGPPAVTAMPPPSTHQ